ncbi:hypothetical protein FSP39_012268 [Pinctada imbricata]|uniref:Homeobox domain-containing protein n=1 Tax=Pinctada imbricata TaxID=66713 RepID=A0AA88Y8P0_PINIB|nr:hypothetical protein FSP39_012268 [Pinctada imbricata]
MADFFDMLLAAPVSPLPIAITATTTLEDVINATILNPDSSTQANSGSTTNANSETHQLSPTDDSSTQGNSPATTQTHTPDYDPSPAESRLDDALYSLLDSPRKATKLTKNPMFRDLQAILKADCSSAASPDSLFKTLPRAKSTNSVVTRELKLQHRLTKLRDYYPTQVTQLSSFHKYQASIVETDRYRELHELNNSRPIMRAAINDFYDQMLHQIIDRVEISVDTMEEALTQQLNATQTQTSTTRPPTQYSAPTQPSLSQRSIRLMEVWYHAHIDHPYPDTQDVETLATAGNITEEQVKKWFANKRNRSRNIRPMSQIVRRKRQIQAAATTNRIIRVPSLC